MSRRRHALNPAKVKADIAALERPASAPAPQRRWDVGRRWSAALLCLLSAALLLISFAPFRCGHLAYVALVPLTLAVAGARSRRWAMLWAYLAGVAFWAAGLYWLTWITLLGYAVVVLYLGAYWLVAGLIVRAGFRRGWPMWLVLPVAWVALEYARAYALWPALAHTSGFPWFYLAHSQYAFTRLIQITDVTGQYGVSFFVAVVNGAAAELLATGLPGTVSRAGRRWRRVVTAVAVPAVAAGGMLGYGTYRLGQNTTRPGPRIGVVQLAFPISLTGRGGTPQETFDQHLHLSQQLKVAGLNLLIWPESMLGFHDMDPARWLALDPDESYPPPGSGPVFKSELQRLIRAYQDNLRRLQALLGEAGCPLLAGGGMPAPGRAGDDGLTSNSALLYELDRAGRIRLTGRYDKMHLVPFSEHVPFRDFWPGLHRFLRRFVPEVMPQLEPGKRPVVFELPYDGRSFRFAVPICYEGVFARVCRRLAVRDGKKSVDLLVNISNDGWFVCSSPRRVYASTELDQHLAQYVFRALENRVPVVRAVNTGISAYIDSNGRIVQVVTHNGRRKMVAGTLVAQTLVDDRVSLYSRAGDVFAYSVCLVAVAGVVALWLRGRRRDERDRNG